VLKDFKAFILRGNVMDLAIAVVIGTAFAALVEAVVKGLLTPLLAIPGTRDFGALEFTISDSRFSYGAVLNELITFLSIAAVVFFLVVKPLNALMALRKTETDVESVTKECDFCLSSVPARAIVCAFCTREIDRPAVS